MASWQFTVELVPTCWAEKSDYDPLELLPDAHDVTKCAWKGVSPDNDFKEILGNVFPVAESWHESRLTWGNEEEHDIQVTLSDEGVELIQVRIDLRQELNEVVIKVVRAAKELNCALFFPEFELITPPNEFYLKQLTSKSCARKFVSRLPRPC